MKYLIIPIKSQFFKSNSKRYKPSKKALKHLLTFTLDTPDVFSEKFYLKNFVKYIRNNPDIFSKEHLHLNFIRSL